MSIEGMILQLLLLMAGCSIFLTQIQVSLSGRS
jgi:hypothetical protein